MKDVGSYATEAISCIVSLVILALLALNGFIVWQHRFEIVLEVRQKVADRNLKQDIKRLDYVRRELPRARDYALKLSNERREAENWEKSRGLAGLNPHSARRYYELDARRRYELLRQEWNRLNRPSFGLLVGTPIAEHFYIANEL